MPWRPLIETVTERAAIAEVIRSIALDLDTWHASQPVAGDAHADRAVLRAYLARDATLEDPDDVMTASLIAAIEAATAGAGLFGGIARTAWTVAHLTGGDQADGVCTAIETALLRILDGDGAEYELVSGIAGFGILALERRESETGARLATRVVDRLEQLVRPERAWFTPAALLPAWQRAEAPDGYWNLGVAHGIPGAIAVLARFVTAGLEVERAARLVDGAVEYLLAAAPARTGDRYPAWLPVVHAAPCRVSWCYGDLGVAIALLSAAIARHRDDWRELAIGLARGMAERPFPDASVVDAGLCHGTAGAAHLFNRLHQATGVDVFRSTARAWLDRTLAIRTAGAIGGFPAFEHQTGALRPAADLLGGAPGIALALHAAITDVEPAWDRLLVTDFSAALS
ncbi:MAG: lanthionine synthetase LanC family protein [Kofleriaceae bacterium]